MRLSRIFIYGLLTLLFIGGGERTTVSAADNTTQQKIEKQSGGEGEKVPDTRFTPEKHQFPAIWSVLPFLVLLAMIVVGPLFFPRVWHGYYPLFVIILGVITGAYYLFYLQESVKLVQYFSDYVSFIALLAAFYVACGGLVIKIDSASQPIVNVGFLVGGSLLATFIGTIGASILLIRPFIRLNQKRVRPYHIIFFIFVVSNIGGLLTPISSPPLFVGYLKGVPFFWNLGALWGYWIFGVGVMALIFYTFDKRNYDHYRATHEELPSHTGDLEIKGVGNLVWLPLIFAVLFLDPSIFDWVPALQYGGAKISFLREILLLLIAYFSYVIADKDCLRANEFNFEPIRKVGYLFAGIFVTIVPVIQYMKYFGTTYLGQSFVNHHTLYWATGGLSSILNNVPTYFGFTASSMGKFGLDIDQQKSVVQFSAEHPELLIVISVAAVFFGALTYIGNIVNFMVKSIAEQSGIQMPSFTGYIVQYAVPFLLPALFLTWFLFIYLF